MTDRIEWAEIEAECGNYRDGFIVVFRKYEGQATDEKDAQGRTVKVTATSFARHMGIPERTFSDWLRKQDGGGRAPARGLGDRNERGARTTLATADDDQLDRIVRDLPPDRRAALSDAVQRDGAQEAVDTSLDVQVARVLTQVARVDVLLREGREFSNLDATKVARLEADLQWAQDVLTTTLAAVPKAGVRAVA